MVRLGCVVAAVLVAGAAVSGCAPGSPGSPGGADGARVDVPTGWHRLTAGVEAPVRMAADGEGDEHVVVKSWDDPEGAEHEAVWAAVGLADQAGIMCQRTEGSALADGPVLVCPDHTARPWVVKLYVVLAERERSALLVIQVYADDLAAASELAKPVVDSFHW